MLGQNPRGIVVVRWKAILVGTVQDRVRDSRPIAGNVRFSVWNQSPEEKVIREELQFTFSFGEG